MFNKIKIASLANDLGIGGTARQIITIDKYLDKDIFEHYIISLNSKDNARAKFLSNKNIFFVEKPEDVARILEQEKINILYCHRHGRNQPEHDEVAKNLPPHIPLLELNTFSARDSGFFGKRCDKHIFVSMTNILKYVKQNSLKFDFRRLKVVYALIDSDNYKSHIDQKEIDEYRKKYDLDGYFVIGRLARPVMGKWDDKMIIFWKKICKLNPKVKFLIYGVPEERRQLIRE